MSALPPYIRCTGVRAPAAKALNGIYELQGLVHGHCCYHQTGVSSGNHIWFAEETPDGEAVWVVTPKDCGVGGEPKAMIAMSPNKARWPWEVDAWSVCGKDKKSLMPAPTMRFIAVHPVAELAIQAPMMAASMQDCPATCRYRCAGQMNGRPAYIQIGGERLRLFFMPKQARWMLAKIGDEGIKTLRARSVPDDGSSWAELWPWEVMAHGWEVPSVPTIGLEDGDAIWSTDSAMEVRLSSPPVRISCDGDGAPVDAYFCGYYEPRGMNNGRVYYVQLLETGSFEEGNTGPMCLWFAEDRGQWVLTGPERLGDSRVVRARVPSRAWWPWEAHLGGTTSPAAVGAVPFASMPVWQGGAAMLASSRANWEVPGPDGAFNTVRGMRVELISSKRLLVVGHKKAKHAFLGEYKQAGLLSSRPFFLQAWAGDETADQKGAPSDTGEEAEEASEGATTARETEKEQGDEEEEEEEEEDEEEIFAAPPPRFALWYAEDTECWLITEDYRLLDEVTVDARVKDTAWFPWEAGVEVADGQGGFVAVAGLRIEEVPELQS